MLPVRLHKYMILTGFSDYFVLLIFPIRNVRCVVALNLFATKLQL